MKWALIGALLGVVGCSGGESNTATHCYVRTSGYSGTATDCTISADCDSTQRRLSCSDAPDGGCACSVNDSVERTFPFDPKYCEYSPDAGNEPNVEKALAACKWSY